MASELVLSLTDRVSGPAKGVERSLRSLDKQRKEVGRGARTTAEDVAGLGTARNMMLAGASRVLAPVAGALSAGQIISAAADFETALTNIQKKSGATAAQTAKLGDEIKALATSGELAVPIEEIAAAYERGAAAGIPLDDLRQFAALSAKAADAFEMSATDVGNASAGFNKVLGVPLNQMQRYFDLINGLADAGIADESGIVDYIDQAGAMAKTFGFSAQETAALGAALANLKVSAAKGATATNSILTRLMAPDALSSDGRTAYYQLIKDDKKFKKQLASGKASEAFVEVVDALKAMDKEKRTGIIVELFGQDHLDVMTQLVEGSEELKRNLAYAAGDSWFGSLDNSYKLKLDDFWSQWQLVKNALAELTINAGSMGLPALKTGLQGLSNLIQQLDQGMKQLEVQIDWSKVQGARDEVGKLGEDLGRILGIDAKGSSLEAFFGDLAKEINEFASAVRTVAKEIRDIADFANDPIGFMKKSSVDPERMRAAGIEPMTDEMRNRIRAQQAAQESEANARADAARSDSLDAFAMGDLPVEQTPRADRGGRVRSADAGSFAPAMPAPAPAPTFADVGRRGLPVPTPRPDIAGAIAAEGEAAALKAQELGQRISDAFSVTAEPQIAQGSINAYIGKLQTAIGLQNQLAERAGRVGGGADYGASQADIED
ncbi:phage tail tape measure protein [Aureimonas phyllosphaerae]|uniref:TP901 family phage tail tape measure protein n=1 Tax=Aureimonas phyllosphaerae TaxID=1166078 RepID=A0A7W6BZB0_9HYPH|nr:phage tail tape measure protein [Aureimonas phyllosphaerae]MBB3937948.1 TP901 family phage tail tape measure protein [Aureimonas phyllosphaerae]MBB3961878.1 TP901 family phage tail tape measure protein [Aureimonas phyllosphaerae]